MPWCGPASSRWLFSAWRSSPTSAPAPSACSLEDNELKVSANSTESGESEDTIDTPYSGEPIVVGFNSGYILDFLKALDNPGEVRLEFKDAQSAGQMRPEDPDAEYKYRYVLMPMRI